MSKPRILIVEDELLVALDLSKRLDFLGFDASTAENGNEALRSFNSLKPDLVLLDINLEGGMDGIETGRRMITINPVPLVFLTSYSDDLTFKRAQELGPSAYLLKPFNERELNLSINLALSNFSKAKNTLEKNKAQKNLDDEFYLVTSSIFLRKKTRFQKVAFKDIILIEADGNCTLIHTRTQKFFLSVTMGIILEELHIPEIVRCHRSYAVNINAVDSFEGNRIFIGEQEIPVSKSYKEGLFDRFRTL